MKTNRSEDVSDVFQLEEIYMQKKVIAAAVAGAFALPAVAFAQSSTVNVFGTMYMEYSFVSQGRNAAGTVDPANVDHLQTPGSEIGFKGEEKLGGGMSAWFQCTTTADPRGVSQNGFCSRNSAVGLKGGFGNFFVGNWDTPFKRSRVGNVGGHDTGIFGTAFLMYGNSTTVTDGANTSVFARRQQNSINYDSPSFGGFQFMGAFSSTNSSTATTTTSAGAKPRIWSLAGVYKAGPLDLGIGWQKHSKQIGANGAPGAFNGDEHGYHLNGAYKFGNVKVGGAYTKQTAELAAGRDADYKAFHLGAEIGLGGPHGVHVGYTKADDVGGTAGAAAVATLRPAATGLSNSGARLWQIRYVHAFSKRTTGEVGYVSLKNDTTATYNLGGVSGAGAGAKSSAVAFTVKHTF
jgi:predicted porin